MYLIDTRFNFMVWMYEFCRFRIIIECSVSLMRQILTVCGLAFVPPAIGRINAREKFFTLKDILINCIIKIYIDKVILINCILFKLII